MQDEPLRPMQDERDVAQSVTYGLTNTAVRHLSRTRMFVVTLQLIGLVSVIFGKI